MKRPKTKGSPDNLEIVERLRELALFMEMEGVAFKPRALERAAALIAGLPRSVAEIYAEGGTKALDELPSLGRGVARRVAELVDTGRLAELEVLQTRTPVDLPALTAVEGIGPKRAQNLWRALRVATVDDLRAVAERHRIRGLRGFSELSEDRILAAVDTYEANAGRRPLHCAVGLAGELERAIAELPGVVEVAVAGSFRRRRETIGDLDLLVAADPKREAAIVAAVVALPAVDRLINHGSSKSSLRLRGDLRGDLRVVAPGSFGAALLYFTGSKAHNMQLRRVARRLGCKFNEHGLFRDSTCLARATEAEIYAGLDLPWIPPELREGEGEIEAAIAGELPTLITAEDLRGDLHAHSNWTGGRASIAAMAEAGAALGREYLAVTDHTQDLATIRGLDEERLRAQLLELRRVERKLGTIRLLAGAEVNVRADGSLDIGDELLAELDLVSVAIHSSLEMPRGEMTGRIIRAVEHPRVHVLCHPFGRTLGRRTPIDFDFEAVLEACRRSGTALEINAQPARLDLPAERVREAVAAGVALSIGSDAHGTEELDLLERFGVDVARRGWTEAPQVVNTLPADELLAQLEAGELSPDARRSDEARARARARVG